MTDALKRIEEKYSSGTRVNVDLVKLARILDKVLNSGVRHDTHIILAGHEEGGLVYGSEDCRENCEGCEVESEAWRTLEEIAR